MALGVGPRMLPRILLWVSRVRLQVGYRGRLHIIVLRYVYTLRLIGPISYPGECDLMVHTRKYSVIF